MGDGGEEIGWCLVAKESKYKNESTGATILCTPHEWIMTDS
jgi:hypothetical protein